MHRRLAFRLSCLDRIWAKRFLRNPRVQLATILANNRMSIIINNETRTTAIPVVMSNGHALCSTKSCFSSSAQSFQFQDPFEPTFPADESLGLPAGAGLHDMRSFWASEQFL